MLASAKMAYRQDVKKLKEFIEETYPKIARKAKAEKADIYRGYETAINNQEYYVRGFSTRGKIPVIPSNISGRLRSLMNAS